MGIIKGNLQFQSPTLLHKAFASKKLNTTNLPRKDGRENGIIQRHGDTGHAFLMWRPEIDDSLGSLAQQPMYSEQSSFSAATHFGTGHANGNRKALFNGLNGDNLGTINLPHRGGDWIWHPFIDRIGISASLDGTVYAINVINGTATKLFEASGGWRMGSSKGDTRLWPMGGQGDISRVAGKVRVAFKISKGNDARIVVIDVESGGLVSERLWKGGAHSDVVDNVTMMHDGLHYYIGNNKRERWVVPVDVTKDPIRYSNHSGHKDMIWRGGKACIFQANWNIIDTNGKVTTSRIKELYTSSVPAMHFAADAHPELSGESVMLVSHYSGGHAANKLPVVGNLPTAFWDFRNNVMAIGPHFQSTDGANYWDGDEQRVNIRTRCETPEGHKTIKLMGITNWPARFGQPFHNNKYGDGIIAELVHPDSTTKDIETFTPPIRKDVEFEVALKEIEVNSDEIVARVVTPLDMEGADQVATS